MIYCFFYRYYTRIIKNHAINNSKNDYFYIKKKKICFKINTERIDFYIIQVLNRSKLHNSKTAIADHFQVFIYCYNL